MTIDQLRHIIKQGESETVEFKLSFNRQSLETIVALSNKKGGKLCIGVSDKGEIVGLKLAKESIQTWQNEIKSKTSPAIFPDIDEVCIDDLTIVVISVPEFPVKPFALQGSYYVRKNNSNHLLTVSEINDIYLQSIQTSWDSYTYPEAKYEDLDEGKINVFTEKVNTSGRFRLSDTPFECLNKLRLLKDKAPTNAAMLLFSKEELYNNVHVGRFKTPSLIIDDKMVRGTLFDTVENTMTYILSHLKVAFEITGETSQRTEIFEYPLPAIREMVLNAIVHRDYTNPTDIQIKIFDKKITIFNPGKLYGNLTIDDLKTDDYQAQSRNKQIAEAFYLTKEIEKYGSGYRRIREQISKYPTMYFEFAETSGGFLTYVGYKEQKINVTKKAYDSVPDSVPDIRLDKMIELISGNNKILLQEIADKLKVSKRTVRRDIEKLKSKNRLTRIGNEKTGYWQLIV